MQTFQKRLEHCGRQIAQAIEESGRPHTEAEHLGLLLWEMDWRAEREALLVETCHANCLEAALASEA